MKKHIWVILVLSALVAIESAVLIPQLFKKKPVKVIPVKPKARIAIVIDDWGYNLKNAEVLAGLKFPITAAVLPNLAFSKEISRLLNKNGHEVILHLPMEPHDKVNLEKNTILTSMDEGSVRDILSRDLEDLEHCAGVSNHMGSAATENKRIMSIVFKALKKKNMYFLDSFVTNKSVCFNLARDMNIRFGRRDVFLDNKLDAEYIKGQIEKLRKVADSNGEAIGIGHDRKVTLQVLSEVIPQLKKKGYQIVTVSRLVR